jgi:hypothetical protein
LAQLLRANHIRGQPHVGGQLARTGLRGGFVLACHLLGAQLRACIASGIDHHAVGRGLVLRNLQQ